jgi:hypothetical protein
MPTRFSARMTPLRANIVGPSCSATSNSACIAACHSALSASFLDLRLQDAPPFALESEKPPVLNQRTANAPRKQWQILLRADEDDIMTVGLLSFAHPAAGAEAKVEAGQFNVKVSDATMEIQNPPFNEVEMAERFATDPTFYRNLAAFVASELRRQAEHADGQSNSGQVIKGQLTELAEGFDSVGAALTVSDGILTPEAAQQASEMITKLRDTYAAFSESHPELIQLAVVGFAGFVLHQFGGASADIGLLVSYAVVKKEKLSDIFASWNSNKSGK